MKIAEDMSVSSRKWEFHQVSSSLRRHLRPHESLPLQLLGLTNRGAPRHRDGLLMLRRQPPDCDLTLAGLFTIDSTTYTKPKYCIRKKRLILNFGEFSNVDATPSLAQSFTVVAHSGITCLVDLNGHSTRRHACLPELMHSLFSTDNEQGQNTSDWSAPECESGGETDEEEIEQALIV